MSKENKAEADILNQLRQQIDSVDDQMLELLNKRMEVVKQVGSLKKNYKSPIYRPEREKSIIDRLEKKSNNDNGVLNRDAIESLYLEIFAISRNLELPERIAYLGPRCSFTHQAAESRFGAMGDYLALNSIKEVFENIETSRTRFGVVPIENNQEGVVNETIDLLGASETINIVSEVAMPIHFAFATVETSVTKIKKVFSRDIAFKQCRKFFEQNFDINEVELIPVSSTAKAVKMALEEPNAAALCPRIAAKEYKLPILFENVEDSENNFTRFLIIAKGIKNQISENDKTTIIAKLSDGPGALAKLLQDFYDANINLTKIESRPAKNGKSFEYIFFIDFDGHEKAPQVKELLENHKNDLRSLGSYAKMC